MREIVPLGYLGKETTLRNYIRAIKPKRTHREMPKQRFETAPGEQLQFDWGSFSYTDDHGTERHIAGLACVLGYSRRLYVRFAHSADIYGLIECLIKAFSHFGGMTNAVLTDHMKTVVISGDECSGYIYNPKMEDFARYLGISIKLARVRRPETKGKVERSIRTIKEGFWPGRTFGALADLNGQALSWCDQYESQPPPEHRNDPHGGIRSRGESRSMDWCLSGASHIRSPSDMPTKACSSIPESATSSSQQQTTRSLPSTPLGSRPGALSIFREGTRSSVI